MILLTQRSTRVLFWGQDWEKKHLHNHWSPVSYGLLHLLSGWITWEPLTICSVLLHLIVCCWSPRAIHVPQSYCTENLSVPALQFQHVTSIAYIASAVTLINTADHGPWWLKVTCLIVILISCLWVNCSQGWSPQWPHACLKAIWPHHLSTFLHHAQVRNRPGITEFCSYKYHLWHPLP